MNQEINNILHRLDQLDKRVKKQEDLWSIERLMSRHQFYYAAGYGEKIVEELWNKDESCSIEYGASGRYIGEQNVKSFYYDKRMAGKLTVVALTSQLITVSDDGCRARGFWIAIGADSDAGDLGPLPPQAGEQRRFLLSSATPDGKRYRAEWQWQQYCVDFVKIKQQWRIQRFHMTEFFRCPFDRDWVLYATERYATDGMWLEAEFDANLEFPHGEHMPSKPSTFHWQYTVDAKPEILPELKEQE